MKKSSWTALHDKLYTCNLHVIIFCGGCHFHGNVTAFQTIMLIHELYVAGDISVEFPVAFLFGFAPLYANEVHFK